MGKAAALDGALTQRDLVESNLSEIEARVAFLMARICLYRAKGSLLEAAASRSRPGKRNAPPGKPFHHVNIVSVATAETVRKLPADTHNPN